MSEIVLQVTATAFFGSWWNPARDPAFALNWQYMTEILLYFTRVILILHATNSGAVKALFHTSQNPTPKLAARTFIQSQYLKALAASFRVGFCDEWKRGLRPARIWVQIWSLLLLPGCNVGVCWIIMLSLNIRNSVVLPALSKPRKTIFIVFRENPEDFKRRVL